MAKSASHILPQAHVCTCISHATVYIRFQHTHPAIPPILYGSANKSWHFSFFRNVVTETPSITVSTQKAIYFCYLVSYVTLICVATSMHTLFVRCRRLFFSALKPFPHLSSLLHARFFTEDNLFEPGMQKRVSACRLNPLWRRSVPGTRGTLRFQRQVFMMV